MDRTIVYPGAIPLDSDILQSQRDALIAVGSSTALVARFDAGQVYIDGLFVQPTAPASLQVVVNPGRAYAAAVVDSLPFGTLPPDGDVIVKTGRTDGAIFTLTPPTTPGNAVRYLIQATLSDSDTTPVVLPYYNAASPDQPYSGQTILAFRR